MTEFGNFGKFVFKFCFTSAFLFFSPPVSLLFSIVSLKRGAMRGKQNNGENNRVSTYYFSFKCMRKL